MATTLLTPSLTSTKLNVSSSATLTMLPKRPSSSSSIPPTLLVRDSPTSTLHDLRLLLSLDKFQRSEEKREILRLQTHFKALKFASREVSATRDRCDNLHELFKRESEPNAFYSLYKLHFQNLQHKLIDTRLEEHSLGACLLDTISAKNSALITQFLSFLRTNPKAVATLLTSLSSEELYDLVKINPSVLKPTSIPDILFHVLFDSPHFADEQTLRQSLWQAIFVNLIKDKKGDSFMMESLERYVRLHHWSPKGGLEVCLMKLLRQGEDALKLFADEDVPRKRSSLMRSRSQTYSSSLLHLHPITTNLNSQAPYHQANAIEVDRFLDGACFELLNVLHLYVPTSLIALTHAILSELPSKLHHYATIQVMVKFFFYRFLGKVLCYPEFFGLCEDHYISEKRRQKILFSVHQRLYRYVTAVTSSAPGWSRRSLNIDPRIRSLVEKIVSLFALPNSSEQAMTDPQDFSTPLVIPSSLNQIPSPMAFPSILPTLLVTSEDLVELYNFFTARLASLDTDKQDTSLLVRFSELLDKLNSVVQEVKSKESNYSALFQVKPLGENKSSGVNFVDDSIAPFSSLNFMSPTSSFEDETLNSSTLQTVGDTLFKVLDSYADSGAQACMRRSFLNASSKSESVPKTIQLAAQAARFYNYLGDAVTFQHTLDLVIGLPDELTRDNHAGLIRDLARNIERTKAVRDLRSKERQTWLAYTQEFENQLRYATIRLESQCSNLRLHTFYSHFRLTKTYDRHRTGLTELAGRTHLDEGELSQVESYLHSSKICNFLPGEERFHLFCLKLQALCSTAMTNLWVCEGYALEAGLFRADTRSRSSTLSHTNSSLSFSSVASSSMRSAHMHNLSGDQIFDSTFTRGLAFATHPDSDFSGSIQLRITALLLSEFFALFRSTDVDGWFSEFVNDYEPPESELETKVCTTPCMVTFSLSEPQDKSNQPMDFSPPLSLSSCSQSPISDSSTSASSVTLTFPNIKPVSNSPHSDYLGLCNQVTLHHSPLHKLRLLFALELRIVANLSASDHPGTDSIVNEIERIFRRTRPRHLFRDLQLVAAFVPSSILDLTDEGKAFWDISLAALSLKKEAVDRAVTLGSTLLEAMARRPDSSSTTAPSPDHLDILEHRQQTEALRLFTLAAKEGHVTAQRELAILYLSLPSSFSEPTAPVPSPSSASSFLGALYGNNNSSSNLPTSSKSPRGQDSDKYDPANVAAALHWFERAASQGDAFSLQYLTHRGGAYSLPAPPRNFHISGTIATSSRYRSIPNSSYSTSSPSVVGVRRATSSPSSPKANSHSIPKHSHHHRASSNLTTSATTTNAVEHLTASTQKFSA